MDDQEHSTHHEQPWSTFQLPPSTKQFPYLPNEILGRILHGLTKTELKALRYVSRQWAYATSVMAPLFSRVDIIPHETVLDEFIGTFGCSRVKYAFREVKFCLGRYYMCRHVAKRLEMLRDGKGVDMYGNALKNVQFSTDHGEVYAEEGRNWMECGQDHLLSQLLDMFRCMPAVRKVDVVCHFKFFQILRKRDPTNPWKCDCSDTHRTYPTTLEHPRTPNPLCRLLYRGRHAGAQNGETPQMHRTLKLIRTRRITATMLPGTIYQALSISKVCVDDVSIDWMGDEVHSFRMLRDWTAALNLFFTSDPIDDALLNLKSLDIGFWNHTTNTEEQSLARLQLLQCSPNLEILQIRWTETHDRCFQEYYPDYSRAASNLIDTLSLSENAIFPKLRSLHMRGLSCRAEELLHLISFHCPSLSILKLDNVAFIHRPPKPPDCWAKFLKSLKRSCGDRVTALEILGSVCNSSYQEGGDVNQHWHISHRWGYLGSRDGLRNRVMQWFHDSDQTDDMCPLNFWELVRDGTVFRGYDIEESYSSASGHRRDWLSLNLSWDDGLPSESEDDDDNICIGFGWD